MGRPSKRLRWHRLQRFSAGLFHALTIRYGRRFLADYPDLWPAWILVGDALAQLLRYEEAEQALVKALEQCPPEGRRIVLGKMGHLFKMAGDYDLAAEWYVRVIDADPADAGGHIFLGAVRAKQGRLREAEDAFRAAIACAEGVVEEAYRNLGIVLLARERFWEAADCFREATRIDPNDRMARWALRDAELCIKLIEAERRRASGSYDRG
jgi:protein O-GlcNAc transferase